MPYRELDILKLGDISPLKPHLKPDEDMPEENKVETDEQGFVKPKVRRGTSWRQKVTERNQVFRNITEYLDRFSKERGSHPTR